MHHLKTFSSGHHTTSGRRDHLRDLLTSSKRSLYVAIVLCALSSLSTLKASVDGFIVNVSYADTPDPDTPRVRPLVNLKSLSLTIWGAKLNAESSRGRAWDVSSEPDGLVRVYLAGRLLRQSGVQRNTLQPFWGLTVGPLAERNFFAGPLVVQIIDQDVLGEEIIEELSLTLPTQSQLGKIQQEPGTEIETLVYQWVSIAPQRSDPEREISLRERPSGSATRQDLSGASSDQGASSSATPSDSSLPSSSRSTREVVSASRLYRAYLRAQFQGDQLEEQRLLLRLAHRYPKTRHGRKAQRILLLDGR